MKNLDPPKILSDLPTNVTILNNEEISIECKALGNPYPKISWQLPSGDVLSGAQLNISAEVRTDISGNFICLAENSVGLDMKAVYVNIIGKTQNTGFIFNMHGHSAKIQ